MKLVKITQLTNEKYLNMFLVEYEDKGETIKWTFSSRNSLDELICKTGERKIDTVCIIPRIIIDGKECVVLTKEFRQPINDYIYSFPAGLVEAGEDPITCCARELKEEIGADEIDEVHALTDVCYNSEGMTDESVIIYEVLVTKLGKQDLQDHEDISTFFVPIEKLNDFLKGKRVSTKAGIYCPMLVREHKLRQDLKNKKNTRK
ncbi:MAG: NUDIX hydrolase [Bacilli bacterium]|nr:NUDIX hydrolase [Bacilli bacterium]